MSLQNRLLLFYLITTFGYSMTGIATFLSIDKTFHSIGYLGIALSLRTLSACIFGYLANHIIKRIDIRRSFFCSLALGLLSIICVFSGFHFNNFFIVLIGLVLIGLPSTLSNIFLTISFKISSESSFFYRKYSGSRELVFGIARLIACLVAPFLIYKFNLNIVIFANLMAYLLGIVLIININFKPISNAKSCDPVIKINYLMLRSKETWMYILQISSSMLMVALIPLLASLNQISLTIHLSPLIRESLWSIEAITMILAGFIYLIAKKAGNNEIVKLLLMLNGSFLFFLLYIKQSILVVAIIMFISVLMMLSFYLFRDDYIVNAGENTRLIEAHAAFSSVMKDLICSISPVILSIVLTSFSLDITISIILLIQTSCYCTYFFLSKRKICF